MKKNILLVIIWTLTLITSFYIGYNLKNYFKHGTVTSKANVYIFWENPQGTDLLYGGNVITDIGEQYLRSIASQGGTYDAIRYISIGNATAAATLTDLATQYERKNGTIVEWINSGDYAYNCTYKFTFTETVTLNAAGLHWDLTAANTLFAVANFQETTFSVNDNCTIRWVITFDAN